MVFRVGPAKKRQGRAPFHRFSLKAPLTNDGIPYLYGSDIHRDSSIVYDTISSWDSNGLTLISQKRSWFIRNLRFIDSDGQKPRYGMKTKFTRFYPDDYYDFDSAGAGRTSYSAAFGSSMGVDGGKVVFGAPSTDRGGLSEAGMAMIADCPMRDSIGQNFRKTLFQPGGAEADAHFGTSVAIKDGLVVITAPYADLSYTNPSGGGVATGRAWLYKADGTLITELDPNGKGFSLNWDHSSTISSSNPRFGYGGVEIDGGTIAISTPYHVDSEYSTLPFGSRVFGTPWAKGAISLFNYDGDLKNTITATKMQGQSMASNHYYYSSTTGLTGLNEFGVYGSSTYGANPFGMADGIIATWNGKVVRTFDYDGNLLKEKTLQATDRLGYRHDTNTDPKLAIGGGRIVCSTNTDINYYNGRGLRWMNYNLDPINVAYSRDADQRTTPYSSSEYGQYLGGMPMTVWSAGGSVDFNSRDGLDGGFEQNDQENVTLWDSAAGLFSEVDGEWTYGPGQYSFKQSYDVDQEARDIDIKFGKVLVGGITSDGVNIFDLDGEQIDTINWRWTGNGVFDDSNGRSTAPSVTGVRMGHGFILTRHARGKSSSGTGEDNYVSITKFPVNPVYTPYDMKNLNRPRAID